MRKSRFSEEKIVGVLREAGAGGRRIGQDQLSAVVRNYGDVLGKALMRRGQGFWC